MFHFTQEMSSEDQQIWKDAAEILTRMDPDIRRLLAFMDSEDGIGVVIRGHLYIERSVEACIDAYLPHPVPYANPILTCDVKIILAQCIGILSVAECSVLKAINALRNKIAHEDHYEPTPQDVSNLCALFRKCPFCASGMESYLEKESSPIMRIRLIVMMIVLSLRIRESFLLKRKLSLVSDDAPSRVAEGAEPPLFGKLVAAYIYHLLQQISKMVSDPLTVMQLTSSAAEGRRTEVAGAIDRLAKSLAPGAEDERTK
jgi:hypothetical protein